MQLSTARADRNAIRFVLGGEVRTVRGVAPTTTVLEYLREHLGRTGTKEGCAEGDCGACTVVVGELAGDGVALRAVNACIQFVPMLDGKALYTVEDLRQAAGALHPVQQAMVGCHASQCGFCTPGFVMSLWALYLDHGQRNSRPDEAQVRTAIAGNLCRCTGYRPIVEAGRRMFDLPPAGFDRSGLREQLRSLAREDPLVYEHDGCRFFAPRSLAELTAMRAAHPQATLVAGATDIALRVTKGLDAIPDIIHVGEVAELAAIHERGDALRIGAGASLAAAYAALARHYPELAEIAERFASPPIRNAGTMGGNVANGSPIGDSMPPLIALGARVVLRSPAGARTLALEDLYLGYTKTALAPDEILEAIEVPLRRPALRFRAYKLSKRYDSDISAVCGAFALDVVAGAIVRARIAFGGMAAVPKRARAVEAALEGRAWTEGAVRAAMAALGTDYTPLSDLRGSAGYRLRAAQNLLYRFFLETRPDDALPAQRLRAFAAGAGDALPR